MFSGAKYCLVTSNDKALTFGFGMRKRAGTAISAGDSAPFNSKRVREPFLSILFLFGTTVQS